MIDACHLSAKPLDMMSDADKTYTEAQAQFIAEHNLANAICKERVHHSRAPTRLRQNLEDKLNKHNREQDASMSLMLSKSNKKFVKLRCEMHTISNKLKDQRVIWQKRLSELDTSSKNQLSKERECRRSSIQQQLDKSSSAEDQLLEIIEGLEIMNDELGENKDVASARLEKLLTEKEATNHLKDDLTSLLKIQQSQQILLGEFNIMIERFQSSKLSLKQEVKLGRRGGACWPLWVTEVCSELLV